MYIKINYKIIKIICTNGLLFKYNSTTMVQELIKINKQKLINK